MMKSVRLEYGYLCMQMMPNTTFPKTDPLLDEALLIRWRTKKVNMIGHHDIKAHEPRVSFSPGCQQCLMDSGTREIWLTIPAADRGEDNSWLTAENTDACCGMFAADVFAHFDSSARQSLALPARKAKEALGAILICR